MPRASLSTQDPTVITFETVTKSLLQLCEGESLDLVELGKGVERVVRSAHAVIEASGRSSTRLEIATRALDLATPKSCLDQCLSSLESRDSGQ